MRITKFTSQFPGFWKYTVVSPVLVFFALPAGVIGVHQPLLIAAGLLFLAETIALIMGIKLKMLFRLILSSPAVFLNGKNLSSIPVNWKRQHNPFMMMFFCSSLFFSSLPEAAYDVTDSLRYERDWSRNEIGSSLNDVIEATCDGCPISLALENVIPNNFKVMIDSGIEDLKVDYADKKPWGVMLNEIANKHDLHIELIRYKHLILVSKSDGDNAGISYVNLVGEKSNFYETKSFEVIVGDSLAETLDRWAQREEWEVVNRLGKNIIMQTSGRFEGNLLEAVKSLIKSFKDRGRLSRVEVNYSVENRVLLITPMEDK
jgi:hypothetical protein